MTLIAVYGAIGLALLVLVTIRPQFFWPAFTCAAIGTSGLMVGGHAVIDEWLCGCVILGGMLSIKISGVPRSNDSPFVGTPRLVFALTMLYMAFQSLRGALFLHNLQVMRYFAYYLMFGALLWIGTGWSFRIPAPRVFCQMVAASSICYFGAYITHGLIADCVRGVGRWSLQGLEWSGSAYAVFPLILMLPAIFLLLRAGDHTYRWFAWTGIASVILTAGYYESRVAWLATFGMLMISPLVLGLPRTIRLLSGVIILCMLSLMLSASRIATPGCWSVLRKSSFSDLVSDLVNAFKLSPGLSLRFVEGMSRTAIAPITPRSSDLDRRLHLLAAFEALKNDSSVLFFGGGIYSHRILLRPPIEKFYARFLPGVKLSPVLRTTGLPALLVDTGLVGLLLLILMIALVGRELFLETRPHWRDTCFLWLVLLQIPLWLAVSNIQDMVPFVWLLMPRGPLVLMIRSQSQPSSTMRGQLAAESASVQRDDS